MKKAFEVALGIVTSIGGFLDAGSIATAMQAGARFGYQLIWATLLGTVCIILLVEMSGRLAAVSHHTLRDAIHKRFGFPFSAVLLTASTALNALVLASEVGGICIALQLVCGVSFRWWAAPVVLVLWLAMWLGTFGVLEKSISVLGLITVAFVVAAFKLHPSWPALGRGALPSFPSHDAANYWYLAVSIIGSIISPFMLFFYSAGAIEEEWDESYLGVNRITATFGMTFGAVIAIGVIVGSALVLAPHGIRVDDYHEGALMLTPVWGLWGFFLFAASLAIASFSAAAEVALATAYEVAQFFGWNWSKNPKPAQEARFSLTYTAALFIPLLIVVSGIDPLKVTVFTMALTCVLLPLVVFPFLVLMNDQRYMQDHPNSRAANYAVAGIVGLASVLAIVAIPLQVLGG